jgi:ribosomal protein S18 acetylase RimI-like enzyme
VQIEIRPATAVDAPLISQLNADVQKFHAEAYPWRFKPPGADTFTDQDAAALLARPDHFALLAHVDGMPAGYVVAEIIRRPETSRHHAHDMVYVHQISVRPVSRRRGVGRALLGAVNARAQSEGISLMALDTWAFNDQALAFFQKCGLVPYNIRLWNKTD